MKMLTTQLITTVEFLSHFQMHSISSTYGHKTGQVNISLLRQPCWECTLKAGFSYSFYVKQSGLRYRINYIPEDGKWKKWH